MQTSLLQRASGLLAALAFTLALNENSGRTADALKPLEVKVARPTHGEIIRYVTLPGNIRADQQATLYAKVGGYLKTLTVDKGDRVQAGQTLGEIEVPELLADLAKYKAEVKVAETDFQRNVLARRQRRAEEVARPRHAAIGGRS